MGRALRAHGFRNPEERLDPNNGIPFVATLDALFDVGLISFDAAGQLLVSSLLSACEREILGIIKPPTTKTADYLAYHRSQYFKK